MDKIDLYLIILALCTCLSTVYSAVAKNSIPFDPFRLECPFFHGIVRLDIQRVESSEAVRVDNMITSYCENLKKLYPSHRDPTLTTADESCRWTSNFRIPAESFDFTETCQGKEFVSGISRQAPGEFGILCCKLKDRKKGGCVDVEFRLPSSDTPAVEVERNKKILTGIGHENGRLVAQFCDMEIMNQREVDEEFIANARARLLSQGKDKVKSAEANDDTETTDSATPKPSSLSPPGIRPPPGFVQQRGRVAPNRQSTTGPSDGDDGESKSTKSTRPSKPGPNDKSGRLAVINSGLSAPAQAGKNVRPTPTRPTTTKGKTTTAASAEETDQPSRPQSTRTTAAKTSNKPKSGQTSTSAPTRASSSRTSKTTTEPIVDSTVTEPTLPDPSNFQVLGIPRPIGSKPLINPKVHFVRPFGASDIDQSDAPDATSESPGSSTPTKSTSLPPAPSLPSDIEGETTSETSETPVNEEATTAGLESGKDKEETSEEKTEKPKAEETKSEKSTSEKPENEGQQSGEVAVEAPVVEFGNVSSISNGIVIDRQKIIESAVAPPKPLFTVFPPLPKFNTGSTTSIAGSASDASTTTVASTTTTFGRLECSSESAYRDSQSNLVVACGQGDDIWVPARCRPGLLCLLAKDSSYRLCCNVRF